MDDGKIAELQDGAVYDPKAVKIRRTVKMPSVWYAIVRVHGDSKDQGKVYAMFSRSDDASDFMYSGEKNVPGDRQWYEIMRMEI